MVSGIGRLERRFAEEAEKIVSEEHKM